MSFIFYAILLLPVKKHWFQDDLPWEHRLQSSYYFGSKFKIGKKHTNEFAHILDKSSVSLPDLLGLFPFLLL